MSLDYDTQKTMLFAVIDVKLGMGNADMSWLNIHYQMALQCTKCNMEWLKLYKPLGNYGCN